MKDGLVRAETLPLVFRAAGHREPAARHPRARPHHRHRPADAGPARQLPRAWTRRPKPTPPKKAKTTSRSRGPLTLAIDVSDETRSRRRGRATSPTPLVEPCCGAPQPACKLARLSRCSGRCWCRWRARRLLTAALRRPRGFNRVFRDTPLEVILVNARSDEPPTKAQAIAQANLAGGGNVERARAVAAAGRHHGRDGRRPEEARRRIDQLQEEQQQLLAQIRREMALLPPPRPAREAGGARRSGQDERRASCCACWPRSRSASTTRTRGPRSATSARPRAKRSTRCTTTPAPPHRRARHARLPEFQGRKLYGELTMNVTVDAAGRVVEAEIVRPSKSRGWTSGRWPSCVRHRPSAPSRRPCAAGRPDRHHLALSLHPRRRPGNHAQQQPLTLGSITATPCSATRWRTAVALHPRRVRAADRRGHGPTGASTARWTASRPRCATLPPPAGAAATSPCPSSSKRRPWPAAHERARLAGAANVLRFDAEGWLADNTDGVAWCATSSKARASRWPASACCWWAPAAPVPACWARLLQASARRGGGGQPHADEGAGPGRAPCRLGGSPRRGADSGQRSGTAGRGFDVVINASASSLQGARLAGAGCVLRPGTLAVDLMYGPAAEPFLAWARATAPWRATAWACWSSRRPKPLRLARRATRRPRPVLQALRANGGWPLSRELIP
jgi:protein TonB